MVVGVKLGGQKKKYQPQIVKFFGRMLLNTLLHTVMSHIMLT